MDTQYNNRARSLAFQRLWGEEGFWSVIFLLMLTTLGSLALSAFFASRESGSNAVNQINLIKADFAATSAIYYGIRRAKAGFMTNETITVDGRPVAISYQRDAANIEIIALSTVDGAERKIKVRITLPYDWENTAIGAGKDVDRFKAFDESGIENPSLIREGTRPPPIDITLLRNLAATQQAATGQQRIFYSSRKFQNMSFPSNQNFYYSQNPKVPNVTIIENGNLEFSNNCVAYGIFIVRNGNVTISNKARVYGVIYCGTDDIVGDESDFTAMGAHIWGNDVYGAVYASGSITAKGSPHECHQVNIRREYIREFLKYTPGGGGNESRIVSWEYMEN